MLEKLLAFDRWLFGQINGAQTNAFFDTIMPVYRDGLTWAPLYVFLILLTVHNFGWRVWPWLVALLACVALTDQLSTGLIKPLVGRLRPCEDPAMEGQVRLLLAQCSGGFSFTSSHATNHTGIAAFLFFTMRHHHGRWALGWWIWALSISYGQVYVGVHYPLDILGGTLLGATVGCFMAWIFNSYIELPQLRVFTPDGPVKEDHP